MHEKECAEGSFQAEGVQACDEEGISDSLRFEGVSGAVQEGFQVLYLLRWW
jgi:hypothetical protein